MGKKLAKSKRPVLFGAKKCPRCKLGILVLDRDITVRNCKMWNGEKLSGGCGNKAYLTDAEKQYLRNADLQFEGGRVIEKFGGHDENA